MQAKTILTVLGGEQTPKDLDPAIAFCRELEAHLSVFLVAAAPPPPSITYGGVPADMWVEIMEEGRNRLAQRAEAVEKHLQEAGISSDVAFEHCAASLMDDVIGKRARYADVTLIVGGPGEAEEGLRDHVVMGALFESGRPLLVLPDASAATLRPSRILLAWDASLEAAKAAYGAIGLMKAADEVRVVLVDPQPMKNGHGPEPGSDIAAYLARHGIKVSVDRIASAGQTVADALLQHAADSSADLIVMGGYGHSRLRERIFGGTTESMLNQEQCAVLLVH